MATKKEGDLTVAQAAKSLGVTQETVRRYIREGKLKAERRRYKGLKKALFITPEEFHRFRDE